MSSKRLQFLCGLSMLALVPVLTRAAEETPAKSRVAAVGLFKNGLAVVKRVVNAPGAGTYLIEDVPEPVHGTFWVESDAQVEARVTVREVEVPAGRSEGADLQGDLAGRQVTVHLRDGKVPPVTGKVVKVDAGKATWNRTYQRPGYGYWYDWSGASAVSSPSPGRFLILETAKGRTYVDSSAIAALEAEGAAGTVARRKPVLLLTVAPLKKDKPATVLISYLAKGLAWSPSYRVDISDPKTLTVEQAAVLKNEMEDLEDAEVQLISGFPSVEFANVTSPLSPRTNWAAFFTQLNQRFSPGHASMGNVVSQQAVMYQQDRGEGPQGVDLVRPAGEGVDLHYQPVGKRTLAEGDSLALSVATAKADYERIVEWIVPDTRNANGQYVQDYERQQNPDKYQDAAWDALRFKNPFDFPMTTAPAMVVGKDRFLGQRLSFWVNPGEQTSLHVTKALSLRTRSVEHEEQKADNREIVWVGGHDYRKVTVKGELAVTNHRQEAVTVLIRRRFSGELLAADESPKSALLEEGVYSVNKRNELTWTLKLKPGEAKTLTYRYAVLVWN
jgi:hypothetical protein